MRVKIICLNRYAINADGSSKQNNIIQTKKYGTIGYGNTVSFRGVETNSIYLLFEAGTYSGATNGLFLILTGNGNSKIVELTNTNGSVEYSKDEETITWTYNYSSGGDTVRLTLLKLY